MFFFSFRFFSGGEARYFPWVLSAAVLGFFLLLVCVCVLQFRKGGKGDLQSSNFGKGSMKCEGGGGMRWGLGGSCVCENIFEKPQKPPKKPKKPKKNPQNPKRNPICFGRFLLSSVEKNKKVGIGDKKYAIRQKVYFG